MAIGITVYRKKEDYEAALGRAALAKEAEIAARVVNADDWAGLFHTFEEIDKAPPLSFAIHGWLQTEGITMYGGLPGHGKTLLGLSTVKALLTGEPLFGHDFFKVDKALLYLPEVGRGPLSHRIKMFRLLPFVNSGSCWCGR